MLQVESQQGSTPPDRQQIHCDDSDRVLQRGKERPTFLQALLCCANGDGLLNPAERKWVVGRAADGGA